VKSSIRIDILSGVPEVLESPLSHSIVVAPERRGSLRFICMIFVSTQRISTEKSMMLPMEEVQG